MYLKQNIIGHVYMALTLRIQEIFILISAVASSMLKFIIWSCECAYVTFLKSSDLYICEKESTIRALAIQFVIPFSTYTCQMNFYVAHMFMKGKMCVTISKARVSFMQNCTYKSHLHEE